MLFSEYIDNAEQCNRLAWSCQKWTIYIIALTLTHNIRFYAMICFWFRSEQKSQIWKLYSAASTFSSCQITPAIMAHSAEVKYPMHASNLFNRFLTKQRSATIFAFLLSIKKISDRYTSYVCVENCSNVKDWK